MSAPLCDRAGLPVWGEFANYPEKVVLYAHSKAKGPLRSNHRKEQNMPGDCKGYRRFSNRRRGFYVGYSAINVGKRARRRADPGSKGGVRKNQIYT